jgi:hypothetical protein
MMIVKTTIDQSIDDRIDDQIRSREKSKVKRRDARATRRFTKLRRRLTDDTREVETVIEQSSFDSNIYNSRARRRLVQEQRFYEIEKL